MPTHVTFAARDEREATLPIPADRASSEQFATWLVAGTDAGYVIKSITQVTSGHQRDPYVTGLKMKLERVPS